MDYGHMNYRLFFVYTLPPHFGHSPHLADSGECLTSLTAVKLLLHPKSLVNQRPRMLFSAFSATAVNRSRPAPRTEGQYKVVTVSYSVCTTMLVVSSWLGGAAEWLENSQIH